MEERVVKLDLGYVPEAAVSGAFLIQDEYRAFLTFNAMKVENDAYDAVGTAVVELIRCSTTKFGYPNDEALAGHPLYGKGLEAYEIFEVLDSNWIAQQREQNRVNFPDPPRKIPTLRHFVFTFHDSTFECLADDIKVEIAKDPFAETLERLSKIFLQ